MCSSFFSFFFLFRQTKLAGEVLEGNTGCQIGNVVGNKGSFGQSKLAGGGLNNKERGRQQKVLEASIIILLMGVSVKCHQLK